MTEINLSEKLQAAIAAIQNEDLQNQIASLCEIPQVLDYFEDVANRDLSLIIKISKSSGDDSIEMIDLSEVELSEVNLTGADLHGVCLIGANLSWAILEETNLTDADLRLADLSGANLKEADLRGANLGGADLSGANLSEAHVWGAIITPSTIVDDLDNLIERGVVLQGFDGEPLTKEAFEFAVVKVAEQGSGFQND